MANSLKNIICEIKTNYGIMAFHFFEKDAPETCSHFISLVNSGYYNDKLFYRVVKGHVIQAGGGGKNIKAEFNKNPHIAGTVGLGRMKEIDSGNSEFYICLAPRPHLDGRYTVFGQLTEGLDVLENIGNLPVKQKFVGESKIPDHSPIIPVIIHRMVVK